MSLAPGPFTFSRDRLRKLWREFQPVPGQFRYDHYTNLARISKSNPEYRPAARKFCLKLFSSVQDPKNHLTELDSSFNPIHLTPFMKTNLSESAVTERASRLLTQLPATAPDILDALPFSVTGLQDYQHQCVDNEAVKIATQVDHWKQLRVVHYVNDFVLRHALHVALCRLEAEGRKSGFVGEPVTDSIMVLLQLSLEISVEEGMRDAKWLIVFAFLWTSWQRSLMIHLWERMASQLHGHDYQNSSSLHRKGTTLIPEIHMSRSRQQLEELRRIPYLCGWAFRSLLNDRANIAMDLRYFSELYYAHFGDRSPKCNPGPTQCGGSSSHDCKRFKDTGPPGTRNQSMHDYKCVGACQRLFWNRDSFVNVSGARAVDIATTDSNTLRFCRVTKSTLTVSHVWSHGQGGRPDNIGLDGSGLNLCLHRRYVDLALSLGCESYWMDTSCIPSEKELRWECVGQINSIFATSGKTVISDRDVMTIDISSRTMRAYESVFATLLVCDWGIRAWTLLEAMRGREGLFLLCRQNDLVNLHQLLLAVHENGRMDLVNLFLARGYLFPPMAISDFELFGTSITNDTEREIEAGFVNIGEAAALLSHRHATRDRDDLLIWSLLIGDIVDESPIAMWERQVGKEIPTGSLISSAQRIQGHPGLGWAPFSPTTLQRLDEQGISSKVYPAYDGSGTVMGLVTAKGLRAKWLTYEFPNASTSIGDVAGTQKSELPGPCMDIAAQRLRGYRWGVLLQTMPRKGPGNIPVSHRESLGSVVAVCGSLDQATWEWKGIYEWDADVALPAFTIKEMLLI